MRAYGQTLVAAVAATSVSLAPLVVGFGAEPPAAAKQPAAAASSGARRTFEPAAGSGAYRALLYLPAGYDERERWPVLLYLHGAIERGDDLESAARTGPPREIEHGRSLPLLVVAPLLPAGQRWSSARLGALLDAVARAERIDPDRVYVSGKSLGGAGAWRLATASPGRFAALVPVSAVADPASVCALDRLPVWAFHNRRDPVVPLERAQEAVAALEACGGDVRLTVYENAGHDAWTAAYGDPKLYDWLLAHVRPAPAAPSPDAGPALDSKPDAS